MVAATATHPLDLTKVRLQTAKVPGQHLVGMFISIIRNEGPLAIYSGLSASLLRQATYSTTRFGVYEYLKKEAAHLYYTAQHANGELLQPLAPGQDYPAPPTYVLLPLSMVAGAAGGLVGNPADIVNIRMQNDRSLPPHEQRGYRNALDGLLRIVREEKGGVRALYTGLAPNISRGVLMTASQVVSYDEAKRALVAFAGLDPKSKTTHFASSLLAGLVATTICSPIDVVKTRIMEGHSTATGKPTSSLEILRTAVKTEGLGFAFRGWLPSFMRLGPQTVLTFIVLEHLKHSRFGMPALP